MDELVKRLESLPLDCESKDFGLLVSDAIKQLDITNQELMREFSMSAPTAERWRNGEAEPLSALRKHVIRFFLKKAHEKESKS